MLAFVFPGQAAHTASMAAVWSGTPVHDVFARVGAAAGIDDLAALADDPTACAATAIAQPAIHAASMAALEALAAAGVQPDLVAGHSLGEVTAAVASGVLGKDDGARVVGVRGRAFASACAHTSGTMAAVLRADPEALAALVGDIDDLVIANTNAPGQTVVSGSATAVAELTDRASELRARVRPLDVEGAFHSPAMETAVAPLVAALDRAVLQDPSRPLVSGVDARTLHLADDVRHGLVEGVLRPVRWIEVQRVLADRVDAIVEVGPGGVLAGCARRTVPDTPVFGVASPDDVTALITSLRDLDLSPAPSSDELASA